MPVKKKRPVKKKIPTAKPKFEPLTLVVYGPSGSGKTSFAAQFPRCGFIYDSQERGIEFLSQRKLVPEPVWKKEIDVDSTKSWPLLVNMVQDCITDNSIDTLVLESVTGVENICFLYHCAESYEGNFTKEGFYSYYAGPKSAARFVWPELISTLDLVFQSRKNVIFTAHSQVKEEADPQGTAVMKYLPYCDKDTWARLHRWASGVFFLGKKIQEDKRKGGIKKVADQNIFDRTAWVNGTPFCDAKNWYGIQQNGFSLGEDPKEGYQNFMKLLK